MDVVEIEPAVVEAAAFFKRENRDVLRDARVHVAIGDARNVLLAADRRCGRHRLRALQPVDRRGRHAVLRAVLRARPLAAGPGGVMVQWIDGYAIQPEDLKMVARTFRHRLPGDDGLARARHRRFHPHGRRRAPPARSRTRASRLAGLALALREDFARLGFRGPSAFLADFLLAEPDAARLTLGAELNTDDLLPLEFSAPKSLHRDTAATNYRMIRGFRTQELPLLAGGGAAQLDTAAARYDLALAYLRKDLTAEASAQLERALARNPHHVPSLLALGRHSCGSTCRCAR